MKVFLNGCFDILSVGHFNILTFARQLADEHGRGEVILALDEDILIMANKGLKRPIFDVHERAKALSDLKINGRNLVDRIEFFETNRVLENLVRRIQPDVLLKGDDWKNKKVIGAEYAGRVVFIERMDYSTTEVIRRVLEKHTVLK